MDIRIGRERWRQTVTIPSAEWVEVGDVPHGVVYIGVGTSRGIVEVVVDNEVVARAEAGGTCIRHTPHVGGKALRVRVRRHPTLPQPASGMTVDVWGCQAMTEAEVPVPRPGPSEAW